MFSPTLKRTVTRDWPGWLAEYTYFTPGIPQTSFSIGVVTRSSTSLALAPGIVTKTSIIGTTICGSSSRGVSRMAKAPTRMAKIITRGVNFELMKARARRPASPRVFIVPPRDHLAAAGRPSRWQCDRPDGARQARSPGPRFLLRPFSPGDNPAFPARWPQRPLPAHLRFEAHVWE